MSFNLEKYNTFGLEVKAAFGFVLNDMAMLPLILKKISESQHGFIVLGGGSDVLFQEDYAGVVVINRLKGMQFEEDANFFYVRAEGGEVFHEVIETCMKRGVYGLEGLALIPGTVGAAPIQNVGAYGSTFSDFCRYVEVMDLKNGKLERIKSQDCAFGYRDSIFKRPENKNRYIVTAVGLEIPKTWNPKRDYAALKAFDTSTPEKLFAAVCAVRSSKLPDPKVLGNAGSFFKNPVVSLEKLKEIQHEFTDVPNYPVDTEGLCKLAAGWLIEKAGCRGIRLGQAGTYERQALVIVNHGGAKAGEIVDMAKHVIKKVQENLVLNWNQKYEFLGELVNAHFK